MLTNIQSLGQRLSEGRICPFQHISFCIHHTLLIIQSVVSLTIHMQRKDDQ